MVECVRMQKTLLIPGIIIVVLLFLGAAYLLSATEETSVTPSVSSQEVGDHVIMLTADGFTPAELTIARGETVTFRTTTGKRFWPASNLHPSHLEYADFDPKAPIEPDGQWSFTFDKAGVWRMHDHLAPYYTGTITVTE
jgi:plastocyanin